MTRNINKHGLLLELETGQFFKVSIHLDGDTYAFYCESKKDFNKITGYNANDIDISDFLQLNDLPQFKIE